MGTQAVGRPGTPVNVVQAVKTLKRKFGLSNHYPLHADLLAIYADVFNGCGRVMTTEELITVYEIRPF